MSGLELSCVIPAYNEEACIKPVLEELVQALDQRQIRYEILVIDNGSVDATGKLIKEVSAKYPQVKGIRFEPNQGYGGAILGGFAQAQGDVIGFVSADGEVMPQSVVQMYDMITSGKLDLCKAKRINRQDGFHRMVLSFGYHLLVGLLFKIHITDVNGYPVFMTRSAYQRLKLSKKDWMINLELLYQARLSGFMTAEVDVRHRKRFGGKSHIRWYTSLGMFLQLFSYWTSASFEPQPEKSNAHLLQTQG